MNSISKVAVIPNLTKRNASGTTFSVIDRLHKLGITVLMSAKYSEFFANNRIRFFDSVDELFSSADMILTIGGDGTIIHAAYHASFYSKPLLGINTGRLGFAAELETDELDMLSRLKDGSYTIEKRMMLKIIHKSEKGEREFRAMNDAVISRGSLSRLIDIDVSLAADKGYICSYRANIDFIIF